MFGFLGFERDTEVFGDMAGLYMGADHRKGYTYTWLPNHLQDGKGQISPRTMLRAVSKAAEVTRDRHPGHEFALHHDAIRQAVQDASQIRVAEIKEDIRWAATAVEKDAADPRCPSWRSWRPTCCSRCADI
ncbi:hypothetical protein ABT173_40215 [Streptomyces sp. NPDC001795]|uniref:hypothetical protein n=1 Tax=Streptomyces sp. NPDC001795 TaxID=3154525 RepID=UPI00332E5F7E